VGIDQPIAEIIETWRKSEDTDHQDEEGEGGASGQERDEEPAYAGEATSRWSNAGSRTLRERRQLQRRDGCIRNPLLYGRRRALAAEGQYVVEDSASAKMIAAKRRVDCDYPSIVLVRLPVLSFDIFSRIPQLSGFHIDEF
jgi:hypothetical protein